MRVGEAVGKAHLVAAVVVVLAVAAHKVAVLAVQVQRGRVLQVALKVVEVAVLVQWVFTVVVAVPVSSG